nr:serine/threonine protein kinase [uncultured Dysosmobacter sp.]
MNNLIFAVIAAMGIPSAITGFCFWLVQRKIEKRDAADKAQREERQKELDKREEIRYKNELYLIKSVGASIALGEATARAVQRIPDAHCNGDMHEALAYAQKVKHEQKDFLTEQAIRAISDDE